jgi:hypothetical protein
MIDFIKDPSFYNFVSGPMVWIAILVFIGGSIYRIRDIVLLAKKEKVVVPFLNLEASIRSILHWIIPYASVGWRKRWEIGRAHV